jgi:hypothetical protein
MIYSDADLDGAVAAGAITAEAAAALRGFAAASRAAPDEEQFRLLTGFNDIFVAIALGVFLIALAWLGGDVAVWAGAALVAAASWALAEYFTRRRRMALPSIVLTISYAGGCATMIGSLFIWLFAGLNIGAGHTSLRDPGSVTAALVLLGLVGALYAHWRRFMVPITFAIGASAAIGAVLVFLLLLFPGLQSFWQPLLFAGGLVLFGIAMAWDISDPMRTTRRTDTAFWLHLAAAPIIVRAAFGVSVAAGGGDGGARALVIVAVYLLMTVIALIIDRRALLTAALAYVLYAMSVIIRDASSPAVSFALSGLVIGASLLMLSAFWHKARRVVVLRLPAEVRRVLPGV